jgi:hypothetical protein
MILGLLRVKTLLESALLAHLVVVAEIPTGRKSGGLLIVDAGGREAVSRKYFEILTRSSWTAHDRLTEGD